MHHPYNSIKVLMFFALTLASITTACQTQTVTPYPTNTYAFELPTPTAQIETSIPLSTIEGTPTTSAQLTAVQTPTPRPIVTRTAPADFDWTKLPNSPTIDENALVIYKYGISLGRNPKNISVVGDCQAIPYVFLGKYGIKQYTLDTDYYLEPMIEFYRASFAREGYAVRGGFTAAAVLSPVQADPKVCKPGEMPLECEWRIQNPSIAFINLETWQNDGTVNRYESYLRKIVEFSIEHGTLPILITKADRAESKIPIINPAMAKIAYEYDIPIVNFWRAAQFLENHGIDPTHEGFHLTQGGYDLKQKLALFALYDVWSQVHPEELVVTQPTAESTAEATPQPESIKTPVINFQCTSNCLYFDLFSTSSQGVQSTGIRELNLDTQKLELISESGIVLQDISPDQAQFLISLGANLFLVERSTGSVKLLLDNLYINGNSSAYLDNSAKTVIALIQDGTNRQIIQLDLDTSAQKAFPTDQTSPARLIVNRSADAIYWESGDCPSFDFCQTDGVWVTSRSSGESQRIESKEKLVFSPQGDTVAFHDPLYSHELNGFHNPILLYEEVAKGISSRRLFAFPDPGGFMVHPEVTGYTYSPDGTKIFVLFDQYSDYFEKSMALYLYEENLTTHLVLEQGVIQGAFGSLKPLVVWSPGGIKVVLILVNTSNGRDYTLEFFQKNTDTLYSDIVPVLDPISLDSFTYPHRAFWVK
jgi:hypothetical protein